MKKVTLAVMMALLLCVTSDASAVVIDGINSAGEWTSALIINGFDGNEAGIPADYNIKRLAMQQDAGGLYILFELYGTPTLSPLPEIGADDPYYRIVMDFDLNGVLNGDDRRIDFNFGGSGVIEVRDGSLVVVSDTGTNADYYDVVELFIPEDMFDSFPLSAFQTFARLDNGGEPTDDRIPNIGFLTPIPEPASMLLFGSGLLGALGLIRRKR